MIRRIRLEAAVVAARLDVAGQSEERRKVMVNILPFRPVLRHRCRPQLSLFSTSIPCASNAVVESVRSSQKILRLSSGHRHQAGSQISPSTWPLSAQSRRRLLVIAYRGGISVDDRKVLRKISSVAQIGEHGASWRGRRTGGGAGKASNKCIQSRVQLVGYARKWFSDDADGTLGRAAAVGRVASRNEDVNCVQEEGVENKSHEEILVEDDVRILANYMTRYNYVRVLEVSRTADSVLAGARVLLLDKPGNVHSIYQKYKVLTEAYYDILATLPAVIPEGPIGILGLGAGTTARLIHHFWPEVDMHGWELDPGVIEAARKFFDLEELEWNESKAQVVVEEKQRLRRRRRNASGGYGVWADESDEVKLSLFEGLRNRDGVDSRSSAGRLRVHIGDALSEANVRVEGGFAGLIVDLFAEGMVVPQLQEADTWRRLRAKLAPGGRIMVNCGGSCVEAAERKDGLERKDGGVTMRETVAAVDAAFPGQLSVINLRDHGDNSIALTGPPPDLEVWRDTLPECLRRGIDDWRPL